MKKLYSRKDYLNGLCTHRQYYAQFVNDDVKIKVIKNIGLKKLLSSEDEHLNDIPMHKWDRMAGFSFSGSRLVQYPTYITPVDIKLIREAEERSDAGVSAATMVCIYKEAGKQIIEENSTKSYGK